MTTLNQLLIILDHLIFDGYFKLNTNGGMRFITNAVNKSTLLTILKI